MRPSSSTHTSSTHPSSHSHRGGRADSRRLRRRSASAEVLRRSLPVTEKPMLECLENRQMLAAGLLGTYFNNRHLVDPAAGTRTDATVAYDWGTGAPGVPGIGVDQFSTIWEGEYIAPVDGNYTFGTISDDGIRLWVNGQQLVNSWIDRGPNTTAPDNIASATPIVLPMTAGQRVPVVLHYYENGGGAVAFFGYKTDVITTPIPAPSAELEDVVRAPTAPTALGATASGSAVTVNWADNSNNERRFLIQRLGGANWQTIAYAIPNATSAVVPLFEGNHTLRVVAETAAGQTLSAEMPVAVGPSNGLMAQYFDDVFNGTGDFTGDGARVVTRIDDGTQTDGGAHQGGVDFGWGDGAAGTSGAPPGLPFDDFSGLWSGTITPTETGLHSFYGHGDDGVMVYVNGQIVGNNPGLHGDQNGATVPIQLTAGTPYQILMHFAERGGGATARLRWTTPSNATISAVPATVLTPVSTLPAAAVVTGTAGPTSVNLNFTENALNDYETLVQYSADGGNTWITTQRFTILDNPNAAPTQRQAATITGLDVATQYRFRIVSRNYAGDTLSNILTLSTTNAPPGELLNTATVVGATGDTNLTANGNLDWVHWGYPDDPTRVHRKHNVVGNRITGFFVIDGPAPGAPTITAIDTTGKTYSWTDDAFGDASQPGNPVLATSANSPVAETAPNAIDNNINTKYLNFDELNTGFRVQLPAATPLNGLNFWSANDAPERDPTSYQLEGSNDGTNFTVVASGAIPDFTARFQQQGVTFPQTAAFRFFRVTFPTVRDAAAANSMQIAEVEFVEPAENLTPPSGTTDAISVSGVGNGFRAIVPARSGGNRRINVYVGASGDVTGTLTATMQDGSAAPVSRTLVNTSGTQAAVYTFEYRSGLATSNLILSWTATAGTGSVILSGVSWSEIVPAAAATNLVAIPTGKGRVALTWNDNSFNETGGFRIERAPDVAGAPGTFAPIATAAENINRFVDANLPDNTRFHYRVVAVNALGDAAPTNLAAATTIIAPIVGLLGEYYNLTAPPADPSTIPTNPVVLTRFDDGTQTDGLVGLGGHQGPIHFNWGDPGSPPGLNVNNFAAIWNGRLIPDFTGLYSFFTDTDDRGRLSIDLNRNGTFETNEIVINTWVDQGPGVRETSETLFPGGIPLTGGQQYNIKMEWYENGGGAVAFVYWNSTFTGDQILPTYATLPPPGQAPTGQVTAPVATPLNSGRVFLEWGYNGPEPTVLFVVERAPVVAGQPGTWQTLSSSTNRKFVDGTTAPETSYYYRVTPATTGGYGTPVLATPSPVTTVAVPAVRGVHVTFYDTPLLTTPNANNPTLGTPWRVADTVESHPNISFAWGAGTPTGAGTGFDPNIFAVRWRGKIKAEFTGEHTFWTEVDDGDRLVIGGAVLRDRLDARQAMTLSVPYIVQMVAGQEYDLSMVMVEDGGDAGARLYWANANVPREVVPLAVLTPVAPDLTPPRITEIVVDGHLPAAVTYTAQQHLLVKFSEPVSGVDELDFQIFGDTIGLVGGEAFNVVFDQASNTAVITFHDGADQPVRHPDGNYSLFTTTNATITDADGNPLDTDGDGQPGGPQTAVPFYFLTGDTQSAQNGTPFRDRIVSFPDYQVLSKNFGLARPSAGDGDINYDGVIDNADFLLLRSLFGTTLAPPPAAPVGSPVPVAPTPKPIATKPKPVATKTSTAAVTATASSAPVAAAMTMTTPAKPTPVAKPAPAKFATRKIGAGDLLA